MIGKKGSVFLGAFLNGPPAEGVFPIQSFSRLSFPARRPSWTSYP